MMSNAALRGAVGLLCVVSTWPVGCAPEATRNRPGAGASADVETRQMVDLERELRQQAASEARTPSTIQRDEMPAPKFLGVGGQETTVNPTGGSIQSTVELANTLANPEIAATSAQESMAGSTPRATIASYVKGRSALARGDVKAAIGPLEQAVQGGGGPVALDALAEALDASGRTTDAFVIRREMARRGWLSSRERTRHAEDLLRRGAVDDAISVAAAGVIMAESPMDRTRAALVLDMTLGVAGRASLGMVLRSLMVADQEIDLDQAGFESPEAVALFWRSLGDDAARGRRISEADMYWRTAAAIDPSLALGSERQVWAAAGLSRDALTQVLILDAIDREDSDIDATIELARDFDIDLSGLGRILAGRLEAEPARLSVTKALAKIDSEAASRAFARIAESGEGASIAGLLVDAAAPGGPREAWQVAAGFGETPDSMDIVVDRLVAGPWSPDDLLRVAIADVEDESDATSLGARVVAAELLRRQARPDLGYSVLEHAQDTSTVARLVRIRLAGDFTDPLEVLAVPALPFDELVEAERISALLLVGEPELAIQVADEALLIAPESAALHAARGQVLSTFRNADFEAWMEFGQAWLLGERGAATCLELARLMASDEVRMRAGPGELERMRRELLGHDAFRRINEADSMGRSMESLEVKRLVEPLLDDPSWKSAAMARMLSAWRSGGRLADGRAQLQSLLEESPGDPVLSDALHAIDRAMDGSRAVAIDLREPMGQEISGHRSRRLEMVLGEIPESRREWLGIARDRIDRMPPGATNDLRRLELFLGSEGAIDSGEVSEIISRFDPDAITPRMRRAFVTVAAALPEGRGREIVESVAAWHQGSGVPVDVDTALAMMYALGPVEGASALNGLAAAPPITRLDLEWHDRLMAPDSIGSLPIESVAAVLEFAVGSGDPDSVPPKLARALVVAAIVAGADGDRVLGILERAREQGWPLHAAWGVENPGTALDVPLLEVASDASLLGAEGVSIRILEEAVDLNPLDPIALNNLGYALLEMGQYEEAARHIQASLKLDPDSPSTADSVGWLRYANGRHDPEDEDGAFQWIVRSIQERSRAGRQISSEVLMHLGDVAWRSGRQGDAVRAWKSILETGVEGVTDRRLAALDAYQIEAWGGVLVPSLELQERLEGRYIEAARLRLEAVAASKEPPTTPTRVDRESGGSVQESGG